MLSRISPMCPLVKVCSSGSVAVAHQDRPARLEVVYGDGYQPRFENPAPPSLGRRFLTCQAALNSRMMATRPQSPLTGQASARLPARHPTRQSRWCAGANSTSPPAMLRLTPAVNGPLTPLCVRRTGTGPGHRPW